MWFCSNKVGSQPYAESGRLADVLALIQVLALDEHSHRSENGLQKELQGPPTSSSSWIELAKQHPEFFRADNEANHAISLVARHVLPKDAMGQRHFPPELAGKLLQAAIDIHDRQISRMYEWKIYIPIIVVVTAGIFTLLGALIRS